MRWVYTVYFTVSYLSLYKNFLESLYLKGKPIPFNENTLIYKILNSYNNVLLINNNTEESISILFKILVTYPHLSFSNYIFTFLYHYIEDNSSFKLKISYFDNSIFCEDKYEIYLKDIKKDFLDTFEKLGNEFIFPKLLISYDVKDKVFSELLHHESITLDNKNVLLMYYYFYHNHNKESKKFVKKLLLSKNDYSKNEAKRWMLQILLKEDHYKNGLFEIVERYLNNKNSSLSLPIIKMVDKIIKFIDINKEHPSEIEASILFYLSNLLRYHNDSKSRLEFLYEHYLVTNHYERPMDLINDLSKELDDKTIFYLKNICIPEVMEKSIYFDNINEVENERVKVCHFLKLNDTKNQEIYLQEIKEKEQNLFVRKESSRIEKNKIYVNIDGVKKLCSNELEDDYKRLLVLIKATNYQKDIDIINIINKLEVYQLPNNLFLKENLEVEKLISNLTERRKSTDRTFNEDMEQIYLLDLESTEVDKLFDIIIYQIKDNFINNKDYGLDVYLSTKIRHGTIANQLRKPLEKENLITLLDKEKDEYEDNPILKNKAYDFDEVEQKIVQDYFKSFSLNHDVIIKKLSNELLQVSTSILRKDLKGDIIENKNEKALFKYYFSTLENKYILYYLLERDISFTEFLDFVLKILWEKTDINLRNIRVEIEENIKKEILKNFDSLQASLSKIQKDMSELTNAITKARTDTNVAIENVIGWFGRMEDSDVSDFDMRNAIIIVQNTFRKENDFCSIKGSIERYFKGSTLDKFVDIYFIIFDNAFKHSGYQDETKLDVEISLNKENSELSILISNGVNREVSIEDLNNQIESIRDEYGTKKATSSINKEGKTGFNKIWRIITKDLDILEDEHQVNFEYKQDDDFINFEIRITMNVERLLV